MHRSSTAAFSLSIYQFPPPLFISSSLPRKISFARAVASNPLGSSLFLRQASTTKACYVIKLRHSSPLFLCTRWERIGKLRTRVARPTRVRIDTEELLFTYGGVMASVREDFSLSGPLHLTAIDWANVHHRRSVAACLVRGVCVQERDRQLERHESQALAPPWWEFFQFKLLCQLKDDADISIFGAIYEFIPLSHSHSDLSKVGIPRYVIAFRGTLAKPDSLTRDLELNFHLIRNTLHTTSRFKIAMQAVRNMVAAEGSSNVWLAGHSLGSAMAMLAGKTMAKTGVFLEAFLFNPPFVSAPIERIKDEGVRHGIRIAGSVITAGLALAAKKNSIINHNNTSSSEDPFLALSAWFPCLFVNSADPICSEYVGYFEHRKKMEEIGLGAIEKLATRHSLGGLIMNAVLKEEVADTSETLHLIPSANLIVVDSTPPRDPRSAHGIQQWWNPDLHLQSQIYNYTYKFRINFYKI